MIRIWWMLLVLSSPFLLLTFFIIFVLGRGLAGLGWSVGHVLPLPLFIGFFASWVSYFVFVLYTAISGVARLVLWTQSFSMATPGANSKSSSSRILEWIAGPPGRFWS